MGKKLTRRQIRDSAFLLLFEKELRNDDPIEVIYDLSEEYEEINICDDVKNKVEGIIQKTDELDGKIASFSEKRKLQRIPKVNLTILRIAFYEILYEEKTPTNVAINEAVLMSRAYAFKEDTSFVNGVLSSFAKSLGDKNVNGMIDTNVINESVDKQGAVVENV